ncbi:MAG: hypothetical protein CMJ75_18670 [Planctomycetaceae bacterium]|nr:hypothetical protein [Planctomycetaceae bacterium]
MAGFHEVQFPTDISWGSEGGPGFKTIINELPSGQEERVALWSGGRMQFNVAYGVRRTSQLATLQTFYRARQGAAYGFRYKDWSDFTSNSTDPSYGSAKGTEDQVIGAGDGSTTTFQLRKTYTSGGESQIRNIFKPVTGTVEVWVNGAAQTEGVDFTVNTETGIVTFSSAPSGGANITASFEFDVPVRFDASADSVLSVSADAFDEGSIRDIGLVEILDPTGGVQSTHPHGGSTVREFTGDITVSSATYLHYLTATNTGYNVDLAETTLDLPEGRPFIMVVNAGSNTFTLRDSAGATISALASGQSARVSAVRNNGGTKVLVTY